MAIDLGDEEPADDLSLIRSGIHYGTPLYMTPEIARGLSDLDEKSDVFALGILLFEMLTLEPFLQGDDVTEIKKKLLDEPYRLPREVAPERKIPKDLQAICMKALHRSRGHRFSVQLLSSRIYNDTGTQKKYLCIGTQVGSDLPDGTTRTLI